jgi:hypothetical protein
MVYPKPFLAFIYPSCTFRTTHIYIFLKIGLEYNVGNGCPYLTGSAFEAFRSLICAPDIIEKMRSLKELSTPNNAGAIYLPQCIDVHYFRLFSSALCLDNLVSRITNLSEGLGCLLADK